MWGIQVRDRTDQIQYFLKGSLKSQKYNAGDIHDLELLLSMFKVEFYFEGLHFFCERWLKYSVNRWTKVSRWAGQEELALSYL